MEDRIMTELEKNEDLDVKSWSEEDVDEAMEIAEEEVGKLLTDEQVQKVCVKIAEEMELDDDDEEDDDDDDD